MTIDEIQEELISTLELVDDWMDRYQMIIEMGEEIELVAPEDHTEENLIDGCQSRVWFVIDTDADGLLHIKADSDALITKGIAAMLIRCYNRQKPQDVCRSPLYFIDRLGLRSHLSPTRSNGLESMYQTIRAKACQLAAEQ